MLATQQTKNVPRKQQKKALPLQGVSEYRPIKGHNKVNNQNVILDADPAYADFENKDNEKKHKRSRGAKNQKHILREVYQD